MINGHNEWENQSDESLHIKKKLFCLHTDQNDLCKQFYLGLF